MRLRAHRTGTKPSLQASRRASGVVVRGGANELLPCPSRLQPTILPNMPGCEVPLDRRAFIVRAAVAVATAVACSTTRIARGQTAVRDRKVVVTIDDGPATGVARDLDSFVRISDALRASFVAEKVPAIMFINER